jgi:protein SCO1/2
MKIQLAQHWFKIVTVLLLALIVGAVIYQTSGNKSTPTYKIIKKAADFQLSGIDNEQVSLQSTKGKARLIYFFYTSCPDVCYPTSVFLSKVQDILVGKGDFTKQAEIFSITFDPNRDTVDKLKTFASQYHPDYSGWKFLRGTEEEVKALAYSYGAAVVKDNKGNFVTHTNTIALIDKKGNLRHSYNANDIELTPQLIAADMLKLIGEKE